MGMPSSFQIRLVFCYGKYILQDEYQKLERSDNRRTLLITTLNHLCYQDYNCLESDSQNDTLMSVDHKKHYDLSDHLEDLSRLPDFEDVIFEVVKNVDFNSAIYSETANGVTVTREVFFKDSPVDTDGEAFFESFEYGDNILSLKSKKIFEKQQAKEKKAKEKDDGGLSTVSSDINKTIHLMMNLQVSNPNISENEVKQLLKHVMDLTK